MKEFFKSLVKSKTRLAITIVVLGVVGYFGYKHFTATAAPTRYVLDQVSKQTIVTSVSGTGQVSQDRTVNITPPGSGKLTAVNVKQGQAIKAGQAIAVLDETNNSIALNQARAGLVSAQANYDQVLAGTTPQDIQLAKLTLDSDQQALDQANSNLTTVTKQQAQAVANAYTALLNSTPQAIAATSNIGSGGMTISGTYTDTTPGSYTIIAYSSGAGLQFSVTGLEIATGTINKNSPSPLGAKGLYLTFSGSIYNNDSWTITLPNTLAANYNNNYNAYQTALLNQSSQLSSAQNQVIAAQNKISQDKINLQVKQQPPTNQQVESAKASLTNAQAQLANAQIAYDNYVLKAPFDGTVAQLNNRTGDQVAATTNIATVITNQSIAVISLNEVDVAKVKEGQRATMTFDAIADLSISGKVGQVDQIGTVSQGVVNYNVKVAFDTEDARVKPGMSVNVAIITQTKPDVLAVPISAVKTLNGRTYVLTLDPKQTVADANQTGVTSGVAPSQITVQTGISNDTYTEILSGLNEGDTVVTQTIAPAAGKSTAASATSILRAGGGGGFGGGGGGVRTGGGAAGRGN